MEEIAPPPNPCSARPAINAGIEGARPPTSSPAEKSTMPSTNGRAGPRSSARSPEMTMPTSWVSRNAEKAQPYRLIPPRSAATAGSTVATASVSKATKETVSKRPMVSPTRLGPNGLSSVSAGSSLRSAIVRPVASKPLPDRGADNAATLGGQYHAAADLRPPLTRLCRPVLDFPARRSPSPNLVPNQRWLDARSWLASFATEQPPERLRHPGGGAHHLLAVVGGSGDSRHAADPRHCHPPRRRLPCRHHLPAHRAQLGAGADLASAPDLATGHLPTRDPARARAARSDSLLATPAPSPPRRNGRAHRRRAGESVHATGSAPVWGADRARAGNWTSELCRAWSSDRWAADAAAPDQPLLPQLAIARWRGSRARWAHRRGQRRPATLRQHGRDVPTRDAPPRGAWHHRAIGRDRRGHLRGDWTDLDCRERATHPQSRCGALGRAIAWHVESRRCRP